MGWIWIALIAQAHDVFEPQPKEKYAGHIARRVESTLVFSRGFAEYERSRLGQESAVFGERDGAFGGLEAGGCRPVGSRFGVAFLCAGPLEV